MANEVLYIRNTRPNAVLVKYEGQKFPVERRGSREDTTALPADAENDPTVQDLLTRGIIEKISKDAFFALGTRGEGRPAYATKKSGEAVNLPMTLVDSREPFQLLDKTVTDSKHLRSPRPEFAERIPSTAEELATGIRQPLPELEQNKSSLAKDVEDPAVAQLTSQVAALSGLVEQLLKAQADAQPANPEAVPVDDDAWQYTEEPAKPAKAAPKSKKK